MLSQNSFHTFGEKVPLGLLYTLMWCSQKEQTECRSGNGMQVGELHGGTSRRCDKGLLNDDAAKPMADEDYRSLRAALQIPMRTKPL